jgi:hypothetical protein
VHYLQMNNTLFQLPTIPNKLCTIHHQILIMLFINTEHIFHPHIICEHIINSYIIYLYSTLFFKVKQREQKKLSSNVSVYIKSDISLLSPKN